MIIKQLIIRIGSVKVDMVRAKLPKVQLPVFSNVGGGQLSWNGSFYHYIKSTFEGFDNGLMVMRYINNIIKVVSVQPKSIFSFYREITTVSTKGSNSYVAGGSVLAGRVNLEYSIPKGIKR